MMLYTWLLIAAVAVGAVYCDDAHEDCCSVEDKKEVLFMWHAAWHSSYTERKVKIMRAVVEDILAKHPGAIELMKRRGIEDLDSAAFRAYAVKVTHGFDLIINLLEEPLVLQEQIHHMAELYGAKVGLKKSYFEAIAESLESVLPKISSCFNAGAWNRCLNRLAHAISEKVEA
jgi:hypothetical protein